jgi:type IV pilus assembly protein PilB
MYARRERELGELLCRRGLVTSSRWREIVALAAASNRQPAELLESLAGLTRVRLLEAVAAETGCVLLEDTPRRLTANILALVPVEIARRHGVLPCGGDERTVDLLVLDPFEPDDGSLAFAIGRGVRRCVADPAAVSALLAEYYGGAGDTSGIPSLTTAEVPTDEPGDLASAAGQEPVVRYVDDVLMQAVREYASDIHFEPFETECRIRCRIDGSLRVWPAPPQHLAKAVISRLKVLAGLDIAERRVPQDGRIPANLAGRAVDLRVSTLPTEYGESVVLRVLDSARAASLGLDSLGLPSGMLAELRAAIGRPSGIVVVTGPTGSGKTTTLYACLRELNEVGIKILTVEDPVEYEIDGVAQVAVNPAAGLTFASALRAFLRQDPDVVMVGEIRDLETARIALQAALTGHLVLTTLHTSDAAGAVTRLIDLGVEPYLVAATLEAVVAQRLVRCICPDCRSEQFPDTEIVERLLPDVLRSEMSFHAGKGCPNCYGTGYRGRMGLFEILRFEDTMRDMVVQGGGTRQLREMVRLRGLPSLRAAGLAAIRSRQTTAEEVLKYVP